jgi:hypothetical protein
MSTGTVQGVEITPGKRKMKLSRVLLEKLTIAQLVKKFSALYGNRRFIAVFTRARHCSLSDYLSNLPCGFVAPGFVTTTWNWR